MTPSVITMLMTSSRDVWEGGERGEEGGKRGRGGTGWNGMGGGEGVVMEITGFQLEQQATQRWGTTEPYPTADGHRDLGREHSVSK